MNYSIHDTVKPILETAVYKFTRTDYAIFPKNKLMFYHPKTRRFAAS